MTHRVTLEYHGIFSSLDWKELFLALLRFEAKPESSKQPLFRAIRTSEFASVLWVDDPTLRYIFWAIVFEPLSFSWTSWTSIAWKYGLAYDWSYSTFALFHDQILDYERGYRAAHSLVEWAVLSMFYFPRDAGPKWGGLCNCALQLASCSKACVKEFCACKGFGLRSTVLEKNERVERCRKMYSRRS